MAPFVIPSNTPIGHSLIFFRCYNPQCGTFHFAVFNEANKAICVGELEDAAAAALALSITNTIQGIDYAETALDPAFDVHELDQGQLKRPPRRDK